MVLSKISRAQYAKWPKPKVVDAVQQTLSKDRLRTPEPIGVIQQFTAVARFVTDWTSYTVPSQSLRPHRPQHLTQHGNF
jgi:hypothetical protein